MCDIKLEAFHTTTLKNADLIKWYNRFIPSNKSNEWLGSGIYFWVDFSDAIYWMKNSNYCVEDMCVICADLKFCRDNILDLDTYDDMKKILDFSNTFNEELSKSDCKKTPKFKDENQRRCFYCNMYKKYNKIDAMIFTFPQEYNYVGFVVKRKQICVNNKECIIVKDFKYIKRSDYDVV